MTKIKITKKEEGLVEASDYINQMKKYFEMPIQTIVPLYKIGDAVTISFWEPYITAALIMGVVWDSHKHQYEYNIAYSSIFPIEKNNIHLGKIEENNILGIV